jgi:hypothetical protein
LPGGSRVGFSAGAVVVSSLSAQAQQLAGFADTSLVNRDNSMAKRQHQPCGNASGRLQARTANRKKRFMSKLYRRLGSAVNIASLLPARPDDAARIEFASPILKATTTGTTL